MIGVDWGTSSFRAFLIADDGRILQTRSAPRGILHVADRQFASVLRDEIGDWLSQGQTRVVISGMIGSRQGWVEAPYVACPAGPAEIARGSIRVPFEGATVSIVPGVSSVDPSGTPEVMRGEETQIIGALPMIGEGLACLPGSHSKWVRIQAGCIATFRTYLTGELFSALRSATILGRMMSDGPTDLPTFDRGVLRSADSGHLLHHLFGVRTLGLFRQLADANSASYLSGLLIGHEIRSALQATQTKKVHLIGSAELVTLYARAISACGATAQTTAPDTAARGLAKLASLHSSSAGPKV